MSNTTTVPSPDRHVPHRISDADALRALLGQSLRTSPPVCIDQRLIDAFGTLTDDMQWIHVDPVRAASEAPGQTTIAHGFLTLALLTRWHFDCFEYPHAKALLNYGFDRIRFTGPVPSGSAVSASFQLVKLDPAGAADLRCFWKVEVRVAGAQRPAVVADWQIQVRF